MTRRMPRTSAGLELVLWSESDARPIGEYGFDSVRDAVLAIESQAVGEAGLRSSAQAYVEALDAAKQAAANSSGLDRWAELDAQASAALIGLRKALRSKVRR